MSEQKQVILILAEPAVAVLEGDYPRVPADVLARHEVSPLAVHAVMGYLARRWNSRERATPQLSQTILANALQLEVRVVRRAVAAAIEGRLLAPVDEPRKGRRQRYSLPWWDGVSEGRERTEGRTEGRTEPRTRPSFLEHGRREEKRRARASAARASVGTPAKTSPPVPADARPPAVADASSDALGFGQQLTAEELAERRARRERASEQWRQEAERRRAERTERIARGFNPPPLSREELDAIRDELSRVSAEAELERQEKRLRTEREHADQELAGYVS